MKNDPDVRQLAAEYQQGATLEDIGRQHGMAFTTVRQRLLAANLRLRAPGRRPATGTRFMTRPGARAKAQARGS
jgi:hypothetical protein